MYREIPDDPEVCAVDEAKVAFWRFADSPFTWGGGGVIIGAALVSPAWFKLVFVCGGVLIAIGLLRAGGFSNQSRIRAVTIVLLLCLGVGWWLLWKVIPKPVEPLTKREAQELMNQLSPANPPLVASPLDEATKPITKSEFLAMLNLWFTQKKNNKGAAQIVIEQDPLPNLLNSQLLDEVENTIHEMRRVENIYPSYSMGATQDEITRYGLVELTSGYLRTKERAIPFVKSICYRRGISPPPSIINEGTTFNINDVEDERLYLEYLANVLRSN
jgi:hypothetical protein